ncbi:MAG: D-TA family PLP-dependent enzyme [Caldilineae bacterium]|nr:MAG: D-TA family PLP-dependent enzyme [Caldilineae bacterium]
MHINELETPVVVVDLDKLAANIHRLQAYLDEHGIANRPHIKTHKIPEIAHMQMDAGAVGITCQKLGEAEVMVQAGIRDIFLPYNLLGPAKLERLMHLTRRARISVTADSPVTIAGYAEAARREGTILPVLVEFDSGGQRCGVQTPQEAVELAQQIASASHLHFGGLMTYPSSDAADEFARAVRDLLKGSGLELERVSGGSTAGMWQAHTHPEINEHRAGMYIYGDRNTVDRGAMTLEECSFFVITTVVSRPTADRGILDGGSKTFSSDASKISGGHGLILEYPEARFYAMSEEHGHVDFSRCPRKPEVGERVTVQPNHCCPVTNLFNHVVGHRNGEVEVIWPVAARGLVQ